MAGAFTHWMIAKTALEKLSDAHPGASDVKTRLPFVLLGAVSPDLPYLVGGSEAAEWADRMHYEKVGLFVRNAAELVSESNINQKKARLAWLLGYVSHVVSDVVVHPVVNAMVGPYRFNAKEHRRCEMIQDTLLFNELTGEELVGGHFHIEVLKASNPSTGRGGINQYVQTLWKLTVEKTYIGQSDMRSLSQIEKAHYRLRLRSVDPDRWFNDYFSRLEIAGSSAMLTRHALGLLGYAYSRASEVERCDRERYYEEAPLPLGEPGSFKTKVFDVAVRETVATWKKLMTDIDRKRINNITTYVKNWDLDLGVDLDRPDLWV